MLDFHARYGCRNAGACCTAGWHIPVSTVQLASLRSAARQGLRAGVAADPFVVAPDLPAGAAAVLAHTADGACVFHDRRAHRCAIQRHAGHAALPVACQIFPRICLTDPRGIHATLSHYCPTAAAMLFDEPGSGVVVTDPPALTGAEHEGLDARDAWPPLLRPGMLMDLESFDVWEQRAIATLLSPAERAEDALVELALRTERVRGWSPGGEPLKDAVNRAFDGEVLTAGVGTTGAPAVSPSGPLQRYLAARLFATWVAYQGHGLRSVIWSVVFALAVVRREIERRASTTRASLLDAIRAADRFLVHLAPREALAGYCSQAERLSAEAYVRRLQTLCEA